MDGAGGRRRFARRLRPWEQADPQHGLDRLTERTAADSARMASAQSLGLRSASRRCSRLRAAGIDAWIDEQLHPESIAESPDLESALARLDTLNLSPEEARDREMDWEPETAVSPLVQKVFKIGKRHKAGLDWRGKNWFKPRCCGPRSAIARCKK